MFIAHQPAQPDRRATAAPSCLRPFVPTGSQLTKPAAFPSFVPVIAMRGLRAAARLQRQLLQAPALEGGCPPRLPAPSAALCHMPCWQGECRCIGQRLAQPRVCLLASRRRRRQPPFIATALPKSSASLDEQQLPLHALIPMCRQLCGRSSWRLQLCRLELRSLCHASKRAAAAAAWREQQQQQQQ